MKAYLKYEWMFVVTNLLMSKNTIKFIDNMTTAKPIEDEDNEYKMGSLNVEEADPGE